MSHVENQKLLDALNCCAAECDHCTIACLEENNVQLLIRCIRLDIDCADICRLVMGFISRGSEHAKHVLKECAELCGDCAAECEKHAHMEHCKRCAEACRACAEACKAA